MLKCSISATSREGIKSPVTVSTILNAFGRSTIWYRVVEYYSAASVPIYSSDMKSNSGFFLAWLVVYLRKWTMSIRILELEATYTCYWLVSQVLARVKCCDRLTTYAHVQSWLQESALPQLDSQWLPSGMAVSTYSRLEHWSWPIAVYALWTSLVWSEMRTKARSMKLWNNKPYL